jgi:NAD(P)-dependent dehydrogenase (short-subunit alcohol dehydrogenase family)
MVSDAPSRTRRRVALVTGGRRGIGGAIALAMAGAGFDVAIVDLARDAEAESTLAAVAAQGAAAHFVQGDIADVDAHARIVDAACALAGVPDCLVNNAGVQTRHRGDLLDTPVASYDRVNGVNARGTFFFTQCVARRMVGTAAPPWTRSIVFVSSISAVYPAATQAEYCVAKAGVSMMAQLYTVRLAAESIAVYEVRPGFIRTAMTADATADKDRMIAEGRVPEPRWGEPGDVGRAVAALASGTIPYATGAALFVDGGFNVKRF